MGDLVWSGTGLFEPAAHFAMPDGMYFHMLSEDVGSRLWADCEGGYRLTGNRSFTVSFSFEPEDERVECFAGSLVRHGYRSGFVDSVGEFIQMVASAMVQDGQFTYELCFGRDGETRNVQEIQFRPVFAPGGRVLAFGGWLVQILPVQVASKHSCSRIVRLDPKHTFVFRIPRRWRRALARARAASRAYDSVERTWHRRVMDAMRGRGVGVDTRSAHRANAAMLARATAAIGWTARGLFTDYWTDYQLLERLIRWTGFCLDMRRAILSEIRRAVSQIAIEVGSPCRLIVKESGGEELVSDLRRKLRSGSVSFMELVKALS